MLFIRYVFHVSFDDEAKKLEAENDTHAEAIPVSLIVKNPAVFKRKVIELAALLEHREFVISRIWRKATNKVEIVTPFCRKTIKSSSSRPSMMWKRLKHLSGKKSRWTGSSGFRQRASSSAAVSW